MNVGGSMRFWLMLLWIRKRDYFNHKLLYLLRLWTTWKLVNWHATRPVFPLTSECSLSTVSFKNYWFWCIFERKFSSIRNSSAFNQQYNLQFIPCFPIAQTSKEHRFQIHIFAARTWIPVNGHCKTIFCEIKGRRIS